MFFLGASGDASAKAERVASALRAVPPEAVDTYRIARGASGLASELCDVSGLAHAAYGMMEEGLILVRPDGYLGYRSDGFDPITLQAYFERVFAWRSSPVPGATV